jgi:hypothetical protein
MYAELMKFYVTGDDLFIFSEVVLIGIYVLLKKKQMETNYPNIKFSC